MLRGQEDANRTRLLALIDRIPEGVPDGWDKITIAVGGLMYIGFSEIHTEKLVCISSRGQSVIDCRSGQKQYCEENYEEENLRAWAEELGEESLAIAGEGGGGLRRYAAGGDILDKVAPFWPREIVIFMSDFHSWYINPEECWIVWEGYEARAYGFSRCGNFFVIATSSDLTIYRRIGQKRG